LGKKRSRGEEVEKRVPQAGKPLNRTKREKTENLIKKKEKGGRKSAGRSGTERGTLKWGTIRGGNMRKKTSKKKKTY